MSAAPCECLKDSVEPRESKHLYICFEPRTVRREHTRWQVTVRGQTECADEVRQTMQKEELDGRGVRLFVRPCHAMAVRPAEP